MAITPKRDDSQKSRMERQVLLRSAYVDLLDLISATLDNLEERDEGPPLVIGEIQRVWV